MHEEGLIVLPQVLNIAEIEQCIPYRKVKELFDVLFDMPFVPASAMAFDRTATRKADSIYVAGSRPKVRVILDLVPDQTYDIRPVFFKDENLFVLIVKKMGQ